MGDPEEIIDTGDETTSGSKSSQSAGSYQNSSRRLYRDTESSVIGGVSSGMGAYFNIDPLIIRILFVVFFFIGGASLLLYLILWIVLPKAETAAQKLEMRGEPVNVSNIEKKVKEEFEAAKENVKAAANSESVKKTKKAIRHAFDLQLSSAPGLSLVEVLSPCPTYWRMTPKKAMEWIENEMTKIFPLGLLKDFELPK